MRGLIASGIIMGCAAMAYADTTPLFFPFCIDTHDSMKRDLPAQAAMLKDLGYDGVGHLWLDNVAERLETLDAKGLRLFQITLRLDVSGEKEPYDPRLDEVLPLLKGRKVQLALLAGGLKPADPTGDERAVAIVREMADKAKDSGTEILLYPHTNDWIERIEDAVRVARKVDRPNVGVMFNLCHWLKVDGKQDLRVLLQDAMPLLRAVSIHGADTAETVQAGTGNWIQPLGQGTYDVESLLVLLRELGYRGPVGLQCWGIPGDAEVHLRQSMQTWKDYAARVYVPEARQ